MTPHVRTHRHVARTRQWVLLCLCVAAPAMVWACWHGAALMVADLSTVRARQNVQEWAAAGKGWTVAGWTETRRQLLFALETTPDDPTLHAYLAQLYFTQGLVAWKDTVQRNAFFEEAEEHLERQLRLRAHDAVAWASLAQARYALARPQPGIQEAWAKAKTYGGRELTVQQALETLVLATWDDATPAMRAWLQQQWRESNAEGRRALKAEAVRVGRGFVFD